MTLNLNEVLSNTEVKLSVRQERKSSCHKNFRTNRTSYILQTFRLFYIFQHLQGFLSLRLSQVLLAASKIKIQSMKVRAPRIMKALCTLASHQIMNLHRTTTSTSVPPTPGSQTGKFEVNNSQYCRVTPIVICLKIPVVPLKVPHPGKHFSSRETRTVI